MPVVCITLNWPYRLAVFLFFDVQQAGRQLAWPKGQIPNCAFSFWYPVVLTGISAPVCKTAR